VFERVFYVVTLHDASVDGVGHGKAGLMSMKSAGGRYTKTRSGFTSTSKCAACQKRSATRRLILISGCQTG
jgi:hypothetical protein